MRAIEPHTEGDPFAVLLNTLTMAGNAAGPSPHAAVGATKHRANLFVVHTGESARSRKGTAHAEVEFIMREATDASGWPTRIMGGLSSGEGVIYTVRDATSRINKEGEQVLDDPGAEDKRLLVVEPEFSSPCASPVATATP